MSRKLKCKCVFLIQTQGVINFCCRKTLVVSFMLLLLYLQEKCYGGPLYRTLDIRDGVKKKLIPCLYKQLKPVLPLSSI